MGADAGLRAHLTSPVAVIVNPAAGLRGPRAGRRRVALAERVLAARHARGTVRLTEGPGHAFELARSAVAARAALVCAWGGDGTVNEIARAVAGTGTALGIVPAGSGNGLARELGIPWDPARALNAALGQRERVIDVGDAGGHLFVNICGIGLDAHVAARFNEHGGRRGLVTYARLSARALVSYVPETYTITPEGGPSFCVRAVIITVANSPEFGNGAIIAPGARVDDGLLDLVVMEERSRLRTIAQLPKLFQGTVDRAPGCSIRKIARATIESERPMMYHVDGEPVSGGTSLRIRVHPGALYVAV